MHEYTNLLVLFRLTSWRMGESLSGNVFADAALLLGLGMITIFSILMLVVLIGQGLIRMVNRYMPLQLPDKTRVKSDPGRPSFSSQTLAAIIGTVEFVTNNKGTITKIEKLD